MFSERQEMFAQSWGPARAGGGPLALTQMMPNLHDAKTAFAGHILYYSYQKLLGIRGISGK